MRLTIIGIMFSPVSSSSDNTLQLLTVIFTGVYVAATLALVVITIWQSKTTLAASNKHVLDQIIASEKQSQAAIDAIHEQIEENKKQTLETIYNQHRPILVCSSYPVEDTLLNSIPLPIKNVGVGIALNIRVVLSYAAADTGEKLQKGYILPSALVPGEEKTVSLNTPGLKNIPDKIGQYSFFPEGPDTSYNQRLVFTYQDIFNRKPLSIYDGRHTTNWKPFVIESNFKYGIDDVCTDWMAFGKIQTKVAYSQRVY